MKNYIKIILTFILVGFLAGCESFLEEFPRLQQSNELTLSSYKGLDAATLGAYSNFCSTGWYGADFEVVGDLKGGNAKRGGANSGRYIPEYLWINTPAQTVGLWTSAYYSIARANNVINAIDAGFSETGVEQADLDALKGECLFIRGLGHWDLVRMYALPYTAGTSNPGVPVVLVTENGYPARNTVGEVYTQVVADLEDAIDLLPENSARGDNSAFATKNAAKAILAKVFLYMERWQDAADLADEIINSGDYELFTAEEYTAWDAENLDGYWGSGTGGSEIIFQVDGTETNTAHGYWLAISYMVDPEGYGDVATSNDLLNLYEAGDVRADLFRTHTPFPGDHWTLKYPGRLGRTPKREYNFPVIRLAEMYLIRAEAILEGASIAGKTALGDYNSIRTHRGLAAAATVSLADIYAERRRELCFEGNELWDLSRTGRSLVRNDYTGTSNQNVPWVQGGSALDNYLWAMPIPQAETDANVNMVQNVGY